MPVTKAAQANAMRSAERAPKEVEAGFICHWRSMSLAAAADMLCWGLDACVNCCPTHR
jgi:hypothetical protein